MSVQTITSINQFPKEFLDSLTPTQLLELKAQLKAADSAAVDFAEQQRSATTRPQSVQLYTLSLTNGYAESDPFEITFPFRALWIYDASDTTTTAALCLHSKEIPHIRNGIPMKKNFIVNFEEQVAQAFITAAAQTGKVLYILVLDRGKIDPGLTISQNAGGVAINEGSAVTTRLRTGLTLTTLASSAIAPIDLNRLVETLQNHTSQVLWLGGSTVTDDTGNYPGTKFEPGDVYAWKNTAALYAYNPGATISDAKIGRNLET